MNKYAGTKTEANLRAAFAGESQARNQYTFFASVAKKEGYEQMAALFLKTAENEKEHAKLWLKELSGIGDTKANLAAAAAGENYEWTGSPVFAYLNILRINNAKQLISTTDLPFSEIAYLVGIEDRYYFSKLFRKMTGMSPTEYYKEVRS